MSPSGIDGARWVIVASRAELIAALPAIALSAKGAPPRADLTDGCMDRCFPSALTAVDRGAAVALLLSANQQLLGLRFPAVGRAIAHWTDRAGRLHFAVSESPSMFTLSSAQPDLLAIASDGISRRKRLLVLDPCFDGRPALVMLWERAEPERVCDRFDVEPSDIDIRTKTQANELYRDVFARNSRPPYTSGIPFRWSSSYCHAKAHAMVGVLRQHRVGAAKAWVFAKPGKVLQIRTTSRRSCRERWAFHVAVVVRSGSGAGAFWVLDPTTNLERGVVSLQDWEAGFGASRGLVRLTAPDAYLLCDEEEREDPHFKTALSPAEVREELKIARCALACLAEREGDPPFRCPK